MSASRRAALAFLLVTPLLVGACDAGAITGLALVPGALALVFIASPLGGRSRAGAPIPCSGYEETACQGGHIRRLCCPQGAKCNFDNGPFVACGEQTCVEGHDRGRCPSPVARTVLAKDEADCTAKYGRWEPACIGRRVANACIPMPPTNYSGPNANPAFTRCGPANAKRCTTHVLIEDCHPTRAELGSAVCDGAWTKICLGGKVEERCLPGGFGAPTFAAKTYATCGDGSCVVGDDRKACP